MGRSGGAFLSEDTLQDRRLCGSSKQSPRPRTGMPVDDKGTRGRHWLRLLRSRWLQIFVSGLVLLFLTERTLVATHNPIFLPSVILLGAFLVPVTSFAYLYERLPGWEIPLPALAACFLWGGVLGTVVAGTLEYNLAASLGFLPKLFIGVSEESAKLIVPLIFYFLGRYRSEASGILIGVATAAGFAGLETMGYGFVTLFQAHGNLGLLDEVLIVRGLTSPAGHLAWTGLVAAVLWRERLKKRRLTLNWRVAGAFATAVVLHALWDTFASVHSPTFVASLGVDLISLLISVVSLVLLLRRVREARREGDGTYAPGGTL